MLTRFFLYHKVVKEQQRLPSDKEIHLNMFLSAFINGSLLGGALIIAIGAQNMFVLRQGMAKDQVFTVALLSSVIDAFLIVLGALGLGSIISAYPLAITAASIGGTGFLLIFGSLSLFKAIKPREIPSFHGEAVTTSFKKAVMMTLAFGLLNPHVYLDTVILLGGIAAPYTLDARKFFVAGAVSASFIWFFALAYGARSLSPLMRHPWGARLLDLLVAVMMFVVAAGLIRDLISRS